MPGKRGLEPLVRLRKTGESEDDLARTLPVLREDEGGAALSIGPALPCGGAPPLNRNAA